MYFDFLYLVVSWSVSWKLVECKIVIVSCEYYWGYGGNGNYGGWIVVLC